MPLIIRIIVIAVDYSYRVCKMNTVFKTEAAARIYLKELAVFNTAANTGGDFYFAFKYFKRIFA